MTETKHPKLLPKNQRLMSPLHFQQLHNKKNYHQNYTNNERIRYAGLNGWLPCREKSTRHNKTRSAKFTTNNPADID